MKVGDLVQRKSLHHSLLPLTLPITGYFKSGQRHVYCIKSINEEKAELHIGGLKYTTFIPLDELIPYERKFKIGDKVKTSKHLRGSLFEEMKGEITGYTFYKNYADVRVPYLYNVKWESDKLKTSSIHSNKDLRLISDKQQRKELLGEIQGFLKRLKVYE